MKILLVCDMFSEGCTGLLVAKALNNLGHSVIFWNAALIENVLTQPYDFTIVWTNNPPARKKFTSPVAYMYLDDPEFYSIHNSSKLPDVMTKDFENVFVNMDWEGRDKKKYTLLPFGCLGEVHQKLPHNSAQSSPYCCDVLFIGTNRGKRPELLSYVTKNIDKKYSFRLLGNGWEHHGISTKAVYFYNFTMALSGAKIVLTEHYKNLFSTNDFEKPAIGGALMISDNKKIKEIYPMCPVYNNYEEAVRLIHYYLEHEDERLSLVQQMREIASRYTYEKQLQKMIDICFNKSSSDVCS